MASSDIRGFIDNRDEKIGRKIRDAEVKKIPYMLIVGEQEEKSRKISVRKHGHGDLGSMGLDEFQSYFNKALNEEGFSIN